MDEQDISDLIASLQGKSDHDLLIGLNVQMGQTLERLEKGDQCMEDLKSRVGRLESFQATLVGIAAAVSFGITLIWDKLGKLFGSGS